MPPELDQSERFSYWHWRGRFDTKQMADAYAADIEKVTALQDEEPPHTQVILDPDGGWNVYVWD